MTWEGILWISVALVALVMRLADLGGAPLSAVEARGATAAWQVAIGEGLPHVDHGAFLLAANSLLFTLFGATDALARVWPALFGSVLALTPLLLRRPLGRVGALAAGAYLAISPTALVASRQLGTTSIAAVGVMIFVGSLTRFLEVERAEWLTIGAVSLAFAVTSGATAYGLLLPLSLALIVLSQLGSDVYRSQVAEDVSRVKPYLPRFFLVLALAVLAFSTGLGWNLSGLGAVGGPLVRWFGRFRSEMNLAAPVSVLLIAYELLSVVFGIGGLTWGVLRDRFGVTAIGLWAGLTALMLGLMPGRAPTDLLWVVLPLALLTGVGVEAVVTGYRAQGSALRFVYVAIVLILWSYGYLMLARYAAFGDPTDLALAVIVMALQALLGLSFALLLGTKETLRVAAVGTGIALMALMVSAGTRAAYVRPSDPQTALVAEPTAMNTRDLVQTLEDLSWRETGMPTTLAFVFEAPPDSVLAWVFRDFKMARRVDRLEDLASDEIGSVVVTARAEDSSALPIDDGYTGQDFTLRHRWHPRLLSCRIWQSDCREAVRWFLFGHASSPPAADRWVVLWRRIEQLDYES